MNSVVTYQSITRAEMTFILIYFFILTVFFADLIYAKECFINIRDDMHPSSPIVYKEVNGLLEFVYPNNVKGNLRFTEGEKISLFCPGWKYKNGSSRNHTKIDRSVETVKCVRDNIVKFNNNDVEFRTLSCANISKPDLQKIDGSCSRDIVDINGKKKNINGQKYALRYNVEIKPSEHKFLNILDLCHNIKNSETFWSHGVVQPTMTANNDDVCSQESIRPKFTVCGLYKKLSMTTKTGPYALSSQERTFNKGMYTYYMPALDPTKNSCLKCVIRGHLTPRGDKIFKFEREATSIYPNSVPMWNTVNGGNWGRVEDYVRAWAHERKQQMHAWTGSFEVLELEYGNENKQIFLGGNGRLPVPKILYKCVVDKVNKEAICFIVLNNPYSIADEEKKCRKPITKCNDIFKEYNEGKKGKLYCCSLGDFYRQNHDLIGLDEIEQYKDYAPMNLKILTKSHLKKKAAKINPEVLEL